jgi:hypothetical protein
MASLDALEDTVPDVDDPMAASAGEEDEGEGDVLMPGDNDSSEEEEEDENEARRIREGFIVDEEEEEEEDDEEDHKKRRKRAKRHHRNRALIFIAFPFAHDQSLQTKRRRRWRMTTLPCSRKIRADLSKRTAVSPVFVVAMTPSLHLWLLPQDGQLSSNPQTMTWTMMSLCLRFKICSVYGTRMTTTTTGNPTWTISSTTLMTQMQPPWTKKSGMRDGVSAV